MISGCCTTEEDHQTDDEKPAGLEESKTDETTRLVERENDLTIEDETANSGGGHF